MKWLPDDPAVRRQLVDKFLVAVAFVALALLVLVVTGCATVSPQQSVAARTVELWADTGTTWQGPPTVEVMSTTAMAALRGRPNVAASYFCDGRKMYVVAEHAVADEDWLSALLIHELTHHKQCIEGRLPGNRCRIEVEAYSAQIAWLHARAAQLGFFAGSNARNHAAWVEGYMRQNFSECL